MSAAEALRAARAVGIRLGLDGDQLILEATAPPPLAVVDLLARNKAGLVTLLRPGNDGWSAEDWQAFFDERAAIAQFDYGLSPREAEARAFQDCVVQWLNRNPEPSPHWQCARCHRPASGDAVVVPFGNGDHHTWLHPGCWPTWFQTRQIRAIAALGTVGVLVACAFPR